MNASSQFPCDSSAPPPEAFDRLLAGEGDALELDEFHRWISENPDRASLVAALRRTSAGGAPLSNPADVEAGLSRLSAKLKYTNGPSAGVSSRAVPTGRATRRSVWALGAAVAVLIGVAIIIPGLRYLGHSANTAALSATREYTSARGQRMHLELPDGSQVVLGPATRLTYSGAVQGRRIVELDGQAFFTILHVNDRPFTVHARETVTQVLGTSFSVRAYDTDRVTRIAVAEGRVAAGKNAEEVVLHAGDVGVIAMDGDIQVVHDASIADMFGWTRGHITFRDVPMQNAIPELEREYNVTILLADPILGERRITTTLVNASVAEMISTIAPVTGAVGKVSGDTVTFGLSKRGG